LISFKKYSCEKGALLHVMASWASIARAAAPPPAAVEEASASTVGLRLLVVDANAIIGGVRLEGVADRAVTVQEVADEIRDKQSRAFLAALPYSLAIREPTEESVKFGEFHVNDSFWFAALLPFVEGIAVMHVGCSVITLSCQPPGGFCNCSALQPLPCNPHQSLLSCHSDTLCA
jgi:PIN domain of ribonuclease